MTVTLLTTEDAGAINIKLGQLQETIDKFIERLDILTSHTGKINYLMNFLDELEKVNGDRIKAKYEKIYESDSYKNKIIQEYLDSKKKKRKIKKS